MGRVLLNFRTQFFKINNFKIKNTRRKSVLEVTAGVSYNAKPLGDTNYCNRARTFCELWLACASIAVPA